MPYSCVDGNVGLTEAKKKQKDEKSIVVSSTKGEILSASVILLYRSQ